MVDVPKPNRRRYRRSYFYASGLIFISLIVYIYIVSDIKSQHIRSQGKHLSEVYGGDVIVEAYGTGIVAPKVPLMITSRVHGEVSNIYLKSGDMVVTGDTLFEMRNTEIESQLVEERALFRLKLQDFSLHQLELEENESSAEIDVYQKRYEYQRAKDLYDAYLVLSKKPQNPISMHDFNTAKRNVSLANEVLKASLVQLDRARSRRHAFSERMELEKHLMSEKIKLLEAKRDNLNVRSTTTGVLASMDVSLGQRISEGEMVAEVVNPEQLIARLNISSADASDVETGMEAEINFGAIRSNGRVVKINPNATGSFVEVDVEILQLPVGARVSMYVSGKIISGIRKNVLYLPSSSILRSNSRINLYVMRDKGSRTAELREVFLGLSSADRIEVVSGLNLAEHVFIEDAAQLGKLERQIAVH